jgi:hypothetical protein
MWSFQGTNLPNAQVVPSLSIEGHSGEHIIKHHIKLSGNCSCAKIEQQGNLSGMLMTEAQEDVSS